MGGFLQRHFKGTCSEFSGVLAMSQRKAHRDVFSEKCVQRVSGASKACLQD